MDHRATEYLLYYTETFCVIPVGLDKIAVLGPGFTVLGGENAQGLTRHLVNWYIVGIGHNGF